jgi:hypothetical protein
MLVGCSSSLRWKTTHFEEEHANEMGWKPRRTQLTMKAKENNAELTLTCIGGGIFNPTINTHVDLVDSPGNNESLYETAVTGPAPSRILWYVAPDGQTLMLVPGYAGTLIEQIRNTKGIRIIYEVQKKNDPSESTFDLTGLNEVANKNGDCHK